MVKEACMVRNKAIPNVRRRAATMAGTGLTVVDRIYASDLNAPIQALGGSCGNVLVSLAMLGHRVAPILSLGADAHGDFLFEELRKAGCRTDYVFRGSDRHSPVIVQYVDAPAGRHRFTSTCPETRRPFPPFSSIDEHDLDEVRHAFRTFTVFYVDRLSSAIVGAMEEAFIAGALVLFEPAGHDDNALVLRALQFCSILKLSDETAGSRFSVGDLNPSLVIIRTHGACGLTVSFKKSERFFRAVPAPRLVDSSGSGDMVTTGLLDRLLSSWHRGADWSIETIYEGVISGQRLAAINCAFAGARGAFLALGAACARRTLDAELDGPLLEHALSVGPYQGY
jgi:fructokinase